MYFSVVGEITHVETFAIGSGIREIARLRKRYGHGRWRKRKGIAKVRLEDGSEHVAEVHWYEATGIGKRIQDRTNSLKVNHERGSTACHLCKE